MRLFTAIDLPEELLVRLERLLAALRPAALLKWSPLHNLHVTTKFVGQWPDARIAELHEALTRMPERSPFEVQVKSLGWFPNEAKPRVLWSGVNGSDALRSLATDTEELLLPLGVAKEARAFSPHLTLARVPTPVPLERVRQTVAQLQPAEIGNFTVSQFSLYSSEPGSNGSTYRKLCNYEFQRARAAAKV